MLNRIADDRAASKVLITSSGNYTAGVPRFEQGYHGIPETTGLSGTKYVMALEGVFEINIVGSPAVGDAVYITRASQVVGLAAGAGNTPIAKVVALPSGAYGTREPAAGKMWVRLLPQLAVQP